MRALRPRLLRPARRLAADSRGSTSIEFALAGSVALALIFAIVDVGRAFIVNGLLGDSIRQISRENQVREVPYSADAFHSAALATITARSAGMLSPAQVVLTTTVFDNFEDLASNTVASGAPPGGEPDQIVKYRLTYDMDYYTPFVGMLMDSAQFNHVVEIIVYNEPDTPS